MLSRARARTSSRTAPVARLSIAQAAKLLEVPESTIRYGHRKGELVPLEQRGIGGQLQFDVEEVRRYGRQRRFGQYDRAFRHVAVTGFAEDSDQVIALRAAGLHVELGASVMSALSTHHDRTGRTILVAPVGVEVELLRAMVRDIQLILVGDARLVDVILAAGAYCIDPYELRLLVQTAWRLVENRSE